jgi:cell division protein FtsL
MKRSSAFTPLIIVITITGILLHIHKRTLFIQESYARQKNERMKNELEHEYQYLTQQLHALHSYQQIESYARNTLRMQPVHIHQIKHIADNTTSSTVIAHDT